jgi:hypothetical protein
LEGESSLSDSTVIPYVSCEHFFIAVDGDRRYYRLIGDEDHARQIYLARRFFQYEAHEWDALPWFIQRAYLEGLKWEGIVNTDGDDNESPVPTPKPTRNSKPVESPIRIDPWDSDDAFTTLGLTVVG